ncbi:vegetative cell wall protein gp1-like [Phacochoerus africanus]|uniref:vegetative cell wall protein gp1-like n=1 Tax=Phacochoerus africanus TaxID=41426 RepID=UPI001FD94FD0|nr:vegetative cell wall protein gp1-like [Phacochoerus africanus]
MEKYILASKLSLYTLKAIPEKKRKVRRWTAPGLPKSLSSPSVSPTPWTRAEWVQENLLPQTTPPENPSRRGPLRCLSCCREPLPFPSPSVASPPPREAPPGLPLPGSSPFPPPLQPHLPRTRRLERSRLGVSKSPGPPSPRNRPRPRLQRPYRFAEAAATPPQLQSRPTRLPSGPPHLAGRLALAAANHTDPPSLARPRAQYVAGGESRGGGYKKKTVRSLRLRASKPTQNACATAGLPPPRD